MIQIQILVQIHPNKNKMCRLKVGLYNERHKSCGPVFKTKGPAAWPITRVSIGMKMKMEYLQLKYRYSPRSVKQRD